MLLLLLLFFSHQSGTLSTIMGVPVRLTNVSVPDGGLQSYDMRVLQLLRMICNGTLAANTGLSTVTYMYIPGELRSGHFSAEAGRLGYVTIPTNKLSFLIPYIQCILTELVERIWLMIRSLHFSCRDYFINSHNFLAWLCIGMVWRKLMLVTIKGQ